MSLLPASGTTAPPAMVVAYPRRLGATAHDRASHHMLTSRLAALLGSACVLDFDPAHARGVTGRIYYVPAITLGQPAAERLGIHHETDLYGGVVPYEFLATKAITHPALANARAAPPHGWQQELGAHLNGCVLAGYTVFSAEDAMHAASLLLRLGAVRLKPVLATAGRGQCTVRNESELREALRNIDQDEMARCGLVLEEHLDDVVTYSVGTVRLPGLCASYVGTQRLTQDNHGEWVYGGSDLLVVRGDFEALRGKHWPDGMREAIDLARGYDAAVAQCYKNFYASRRNYDVAEGRNSAGQCRRGVLEQSWRAGGASMAEVCALEAFCADPNLERVRARTTEMYGMAGDPSDGDPSDGDPSGGDPSGATTLIYDDEDPVVGRIRKTAGIVRYGDT